VSQIRVNQKKQGLIGHLVPLWGPQFILASLYTLEKYTEPPDLYLFTC